MKAKYIYIANSETNEFHSIKQQKPQCNVSKIKKSNAVFFLRGRDARAQNYDACAWCTRYWKSNR